MYKYTYDDEKEPTKIEDKEDIFLRRFKKAVTLLGIAAAIILAICMIYTYILHNII